MFLFLSFFILKYVASKLNPSKRVRRIGSDFEEFKLAATKDNRILNAVESFHLDEQTTAARDVFNKLLCSANVTEFIDTSQKHRIPIEHLLYQWNYVPAEDSPKHILNALNDDCIKEILRRLTDPIDFLHAAEVCQRFQANALQCFPPDFKRLTLSHENKATDSYTGLSMTLAPNFLQTFGHFVQRLELVGDVTDGTLSMIARFCGESVFVLYIRGNEKSTANLNALSKFKALELVEIEKVSICGIDLHENLEHLFISEVKDLQFVMKPLPNLKSLHFFRVANLNDDAVNECITLCSNIEFFCILGCKQVTSSALNNITNRLPNLEYLCVNLPETVTMSEYTEFVNHTSKLRKLESLDVSVFHLYPVKILIDSLVQNIPTIECLWTRGFGDFEEAIDGILKLKQLKELHFDAYFQNSQTSTDEIVIQLIQGLPALEGMSFYGKTLTESALKNILKHSEHLTNLHIYIGKMDIDLATYRSILALIKGHLVVEIKINDGNIDENIFKQNEQQLKITRSY